MFSAKNPFSRLREKRMFSIKNPLSYLREKHDISYQNPSFHRKEKRDTISIYIFATGLNFFYNTSIKSERGVLYDIG